MRKQKHGENFKSINHVLVFKSAKEECVGSTHSTGRASMIIFHTYLTTFSVNNVLWHDAPKKCVEMQKENSPPEGTDAPNTFATIQICFTLNHDAFHPFAFETFSKSRLFETNFLVNGENKRLRIIRASRWCSKMKTNC